MKRRRSGTVAGALLLLLLAGISLWSIWQIRDASRSTRHAIVLMQNAAGLLSAVTEAETGQRGFALTGDEIFLQPYVLVRDGIAGRMQELRALTDDGEARRHLEVLLPRVDEKVIELSRLVELQRRTGMVAIRDVVKSGQDGQAMDVIRSEVRSFIQLEDAARALHEDRFESGLRILIACLVVIGLLGLWWMASVTHRVRGNGPRLTTPA